MPPPCSELSCGAHLPLRRAKSSLPHRPLGIGPCTPCLLSLPVFSPPATLTCPSLNNMPSCPSPPAPHFCPGPSAWSAALDHSVTCAFSLLRAVLLRPACKTTPCRHPFIILCPDPALFPAEHLSSFFHLLVHLFGDLCTRGSHSEVRSSKRDHLIQHTAGAPNTVLGDTVGSSYSAAAHGDITWPRADGPPTAGALPGCWAGS